MCDGRPALFENLHWKRYGGFWREILKVICSQRHTLLGHAVLVLCSEMRVHDLYVFEYQMNQG
jgi:hypothetical protein